MDMLAVDLTPVPAAGIGSEVTLWGRGPGGACWPIDESRMPPAPSATS